VLLLALSTLGLAGGGLAAGAPRGGAAETPPAAPAAGRPVAPPPPATEEPAPPPPPGQFEPLRGAPDALARLHTALLAAARGEGTARIVHLGDSHVAADLWTSSLRHELQRRFGDGGPGLVALGRSPRRYVHRDVRQRRSRRWQEEWVREKQWRPDGLYGLSGVQVRSERPGEWLALESPPRGEFGRRFDRLELFYWEGRRGAPFELRVDGRRVARGNSRSRAPQLGILRHELRSGPHEVVLRQTGKGELVVFGLALERGDAGVVYDVGGINGARAASILRWDPSLLQAQLAARRPDLVILGFGTNESGDREEPLAAYEERLRAVLQRLHDAAPEAGCLLLGPTDAPLLEAPTGCVLPNPRVAEVAATQRQLAAEFGCAAWDTQAAMGGPLAMIDWRLASPALASRDLVHLNTAGYARLAELSLEALLADLLPHL